MLLALSFTNVAGPTFVPATGCSGCRWTDHDPHDHADRAHPDNHNHDPAHCAQQCIRDRARPYGPQEADPSAWAESDAHDPEPT